MSDTTRLVRAGETRAFGDFTKQIRAYGLLHTKRRLWVREGTLLSSFLDVDREGMSYGPINYSVSFGMNLGVRVMNSDSEGLDLNGPRSDKPEFRELRLHLRFNAKSWSQYDRTLQDMTRFVTEVGLPWFDEQEAKAASGVCSDVLSLDEIRLLQEHVEASPSVANIQLSRRLLGLRKQTIS